MPDEEGYTADTMVGVSCRGVLLIGDPCVRALTTLSSLVYAIVSPETEEKAAENEP
jgi:hypothetical protein